MAKNPRNWYDAMPAIGVEQVEPKADKEEKPKRGPGRPKKVAEDAKGTTAEDN